MTVSITTAAVFLTASCVIGLRMSSLGEAMSSAISIASGRKFRGEPQGSWGGGGGGASVGVISDGASKYFYKSTGLFGFDMLRGEFESNLAMSATKTIKVPTPLCIGTSDSSAFAVFEYLQLGGAGNARRYGKELAALHSSTSSNGKFGFHVNNTIGATFQPNNWCDSWAEFYDIHRLGHMLALAKRDGASFPYEAELRVKVKGLLQQHEIVPGLVHGDLWSGNAGFTTAGDPVIYDPSSYYGDPEVDIAMTKLFGSNSKEFYDSYHAERKPLPGWELRTVIYNSYHLLNHFVLFGGGYLQQAESYFENVLKA